MKVNLVSLDAVTHFVTHCLLCTDRHFIFKYSACHFHDTKRSAHFFRKGSVPTLGTYLRLPRLGEGGR